MNQNVKGILALALVTALSFGVIVGTRALTIQPDDGNNGTSQSVPAQSSEELDVTGFDGIRSAVRYLDNDGKVAGYTVTSFAKGYAGDVVCEVSFSADGQTVLGVKVVEQQETDQVGTKVTEADFLNQFQNVSLPVYLPGMMVGTTSSEETSEPAEEFGELQDGEYEASGEADSNDFVPTVKMTVSGGKITAVSWDEVNAEGQSKSVMSENGEYTMTEDGPTWAEQSKALADALIANQSLSVFTMDESGKTDAVSGVSISIAGFVSLAEQCMRQASGEVLSLQDGEYEASGEADSNGFVPTVKMTVSGGKITAVSWDEVNAEGQSKSVMSENGEYTMTEDGPTWAEQSKALADALIANQSLSVFTMDESGKTDAVSGVSISIAGFVSLAEQ
ncbi:MAG: FMN-binding protein, partial [Candidatus Merdivicinus sp.]